MKRVEHIGINYGVCNTVKYKSSFFRKLARNLSFLSFLHHPLQMGQARIQIHLIW